jgi:hypothetical protein
MILASDENIEIIRNFPFVKNIIAILEDFNMKLAEYQEDISPNPSKGGEYSLPFWEDWGGVQDTVKNKLSNQLLSLQGNYFAKNNINGKGVRIAVFDGGFPGVNTHEAFEHLRQNNQIIKTWNFPRKKEDVYGWNSHGTMVLSCIAGMKKDGKLLGLATGAEFLLARTEVNTEPKKEEFWWLQAVEWADKNGANIINSSLGYGIDRYNYENMDGKTTLVTKAANMAAAKGILVCNSAGNEGSDSKWYKIIAPADADSILTVGGINADLIRFQRINFSSYGPTADGRMKPNVVAFGSVNAAKPSENIYTNTQGTSFSSPLVAGFAACAWQTNRNLTAMELKTEIEKSASLYPYFDYAYGYGIPQASYFTENEKPEIEKTFEITINDTAIIITPFIEKLDFLQIPYLFYNIQNENGTLEHYVQIDLYKYYTNGERTNYDIVLKIGSSLKNKTLNVSLNGYFESHKIETTRYGSSYVNYFLRSEPFMIVDVKEQQPSKWGYKAKHFMTGYMAYSMFLSNGYGYYNCAKSHRFDIGIRYKYNVNKWYAVGGNLEYGIRKLHYNTDILWVYGDLRFPFSVREKLPTIKYDKLVTHKINLEFFQRFNLGTTSFGNIYFDLGIFGDVNLSSKNKILWEEEIWGTIRKTKTTYKVELPKRFGYGVKARFGYGALAIFAQWQLPHIVSYKLKPYHDSWLSLGVELSVPW